MNKWEVIDRVGNIDDDVMPVWDNSCFYEYAPNDWTEQNSKILYDIWSRAI